jgi:hypothetical protein
MVDSRPPIGEYELIHNPGYDFLRLLGWMDEADPRDLDLPFAPYFIPVIAILAACCAIEGYINMVGQKADPNWRDFEKGPIPIKSRISRIYELMGKRADFGQGIWQRVLLLFKMRVKLVHPKYVAKSERRRTEIPDIFKSVKAKYPPRATRQLAEEAVDILLSDTGLTELRHQWRWGSYHGPPRQT